MNDEFNADDDDDVDDGIPVELLNNFDTFKNNNNNQRNYETIKTNINKKDADIETIPWYELVA